MNPKVPIGVLAEVIGRKPLGINHACTAVRNYACANDLVRPGRYITCDAKLQNLFEGAHLVHYASVRKYVIKHLVEPDTAGVETIREALNYKNSLREKHRKTRDPQTRELMVQPNRELSEICGTNPLTWRKILKTVWRCGERDKQFPKVIKCDEKLKRLTGFREIHKRELRRLLTRHVSNIE